MARRPVAPPGPPEVEDQAPSVADIVEILGEIHKGIRLLHLRLDSVEAKIVSGGTSVVAPTTGRTRPVTLVGRKKT